MKIFGLAGAEHDPAKFGILVLVPYLLNLAELMMRAHYSPNIRTHPGYVSGSKMIIYSNKADKRREAGVAVSYASTLTATNKKEARTVRMADGVSSDVLAGHS